MNPTTSFNNSIPNSPSEITKDVNTISHYSKLNNINKKIENQKNRNENNLPFNDRNGKIHLIRIKFKSI